MKKWLISLMMALTLTACKPSQMDEASGLINIISSLAKLVGLGGGDNIHQLEQIPAPPAPTVQPNTYPPELLQATAQTYRNPLTYTPIEPKTVYYFNHDGKTASSAQTGGFYREVLGKTAEGNLVVQDFYQDNSFPQTSAVRLKKDAKPDDFSTDTIDDLNIWFDKNGAVTSFARFKNGQLDGVQYFVHQNKIIGQLEEKQGHERMMLFHDNGKVLADINPPKFILFRENGRALAQIQQRDDLKIQALWNEQGVVPESAEELGALHEETVALMEHVKILWEYVGQ